MKKEPPKGPIIKRDEHNMLDKNDTDRVLKKVTEDLITTQRDQQKDNEMRRAIGNRRDVIVKTIIYQRNTQNGHVIQEDYKDIGFEKLSDDPLDHYRYKMFEFIDGEIMAKEMPMSMTNVGKWTMGMFKCVVNYLAKMNVMNRV